MTPRLSCLSDALDEVLGFLLFKEQENCRRTSRLLMHAVDRLDRLNRRPRHRNTTRSLMYIGNDAVETFNPLWTNRWDRKASPDNALTIMSAVETVPSMAFVKVVIIDCHDLDEEQSARLGQILQQRLRDCDEFHFSARPKAHLLPDFSVLQQIDLGRFILRNFLSDPATATSCLHMLMTSFPQLRSFRMENYQTWTQAFRCEFSHFLWRLIQYARNDRTPEKTCYVRLCV